MTNYWWSCKTCGHETYDSRDAFLHQKDTGHEGNGLVAANINGGPGSSKAARRAALEATAAAIRDAKVKGGRG